MSIRRNIRKQGGGYANALADMEAGAPPRLAEQENARKVGTCVLVNATPHSITLDLPCKDQIEIPAANEPMRVETERRKFHQPPVTGMHIDEDVGLENIPHGRETNVVVICSSRVRDHIASRVFDEKKVMWKYRKHWHWAAPTDFVRDEEGRIQAAKGLAIRSRGRIKD